MNEDRLLNVKQVAELLSCCVSVIWRDVRHHKFPVPVKHGTATRWKMSDLQRFISELQPAEKLELTKMR
jgi:predicted DNA-binding transcriptional regulator AlpA